MTKLEPSTRSAGQQALGLLAALAICLAVGGLGAVVTTPQIPLWYEHITKPAWTPPNELFGPVWTILYTMMAVAAWLVWRGKGHDLRGPLMLFAIQLALNGIWSPLFFGLHRVGWALLDIVLLGCAIPATAVAFWPRSRWAAALLAPYWLWVEFATALNGAIWWMN